MKFYKRFPGDIMKKTSGLTMAQFGAYDRLIDWCYANEKPVDPEEIYTITHAQSPADRKAVDRVLAKFFTLSGDGYRQERIEEVIAEALPKIAAARENGKKGGRPITKPSGLFSETKAETENADFGKAIQSQTSSTKKKKARERAAPLAGPDCPCEVDAAVWSDWLTLRRKKNAPVTDTVVAGAATEAAKAGMSLTDFLRVWCLRGTQGLMADWLKPNESQPQSPSGETAWQRSQRERVAEMTGGLVSRKAPGTAIKTMEVIDAPAPALRVG